MLSVKEQRDASYSGLVNTVRSHISNAVHNGAFSTTIYGLPDGIFQEANRTAFPSMHTEFRPKCRGGPSEHHFISWRNPSDKHEAYESHLCAQHAHTATIDGINARLKYHIKTASSHGNYQTSYFLNPDAVKLIVEHIPEGYAHHIIEHGDHLCELRLSWDIGEGTKFTLTYDSVANLNITVDRLEIIKKLLSECSAGYAYSYGNIMNTILEKFPQTPILFVVEIVEMMASMKVATITYPATVYEPTTICLSRIGVEMLKGIYNM